MSSNSGISVYYSTYSKLISCSVIDPLSNIVGLWCYGRKFVYSKTGINISCLYDLCSVFLDECNCVDDLFPANRCRDRTVNYCISVDLSSPRYPLGIVTRDLCCCRKLISYSFACGYFDSNRSQLLVCIYCWIKCYGMVSSKLSCYSQITCDYRGGSELFSSVEPAIKVDSGSFGSFLGRIGRHVCSKSFTVLYGNSLVFFAFNFKCYCKCVCICASFGTCTIFLLIISCIGIFVAVLCVLVISCICVLIVSCISAIVIESRSVNCSVFNVFAVNTRIILLLFCLFFSLLRCVYHSVQAAELGVVKRDCAGCCVCLEVLYLLCGRVVQGDLKDFKISVAGKFLGCQCDSYLSVRRKFHVLSLGLAFGCLVRILVCRLGRSEMRIDGLYCGYAAAKLFFYSFLRTCKGITHDFLRECDYAFRKNSLVCCNGDLQAVCVCGGLGLAYDCKGLCRHHADHHYHGEEQC